ncbi:MAG: Asp-tRNA(Asn)/Glu-tRNA(Gln) amidotransferase subunit GatB [Candidatus Kerfeldbacteria bacterium]|nr:Asp-tRNA(Asn)/Glu-tRNA(Gln) amidotransferase subunit GatB [Candidatus Kerfeldbacteria bacterium]
MAQSYEAVIGLEIHVQLATKSKMFSGDSNADSLEPNVHVNPVSMGHPGTLPVVNQAAVEMGIMAGIALGCQISELTKFDRKQYFYPDLPKGYQITQHDLPLCRNGKLTIYEDDVTPIEIGLERIHLEEDAAKNVHTETATLVDFNRAGAPLIEIVTKPELRSAKQARLFLQELQMLIRYLGISDADMEKGHMRMDVNVSIRPVGDEALYPRTEIKNMNSFKAVERAADYEIKEQTKLWEQHKAPEQFRTCGWDDAAGVTLEQRVKEAAADYRYFPEPDIPPLRITQQDLDRIALRIPELPIQRRDRFREEYFLSYYDAKVLTADPRVADYFEAVVSELRAWLNSLDSMEGSDEEVWEREGTKLCRQACNWITSELFGQLAKAKLDFKELKITAENLAEFISLVHQNKVNSSAAQTILRHMFEHGSDPSQVMAELDLEQVHDAGQLEQACADAIATNPKIVEQYQAGHERVLMYLIGQVMKAMKGKANPEMVTALLRKKLNP